MSALTGLTGQRLLIDVSCYCLQHFSGGHSRVSNIESTFMYVSTASASMRHRRHVYTRLRSLRLLMSMLSLCVDKNLVAERYVFNGYAIRMHLRTTPLYVVMT